MTPIPWYVPVVFAIAVVGVAWIGVRRSERAAAVWGAAMKRLRRGTVPDAAEEKFIASVTPDQDARDKGAV